MKLTIENLSKEYKDQLVFKDLNFQVKTNEFISILGPSGCGKSTILKLIIGSLKRTSGSIRVEDKEVGSFSKHFAYMPQEDLLLPWMRVIDNVCLYANLHGINKKEEAKRLLQQFGLGGYENAYPNTLSGGMRQRAAFLRTALCEADIILLDEPFGALDIITREEMQDWLLHIRETFDKTIILVTHDIDEAVYLSDRILLLSKKPSYIMDELLIHTKERTREWLYQESDLCLSIREKLKGEIEDV